MTHIPSFNNRRDHLLFPRQQSRTMQEQEWENRVAMPEPWGRVILNGLCFAAFLACVILGVAYG